MYSLNSVVEIVKELESVTSTKAKEHILRKNADNTVLQKVLFYTYGDMQYGVQKKTIEKMTFGNDEDYRWDNVWSMFEDLSKSNINNDLVLKISNTVGYYTDKNIQDLLLKILLKDLRCNINVKSINKAIPNLIPIFGVQLAESYDKYKKLIDGNKEFILSTKLDGGRLLVINREDETLFYTRAGKQMEGLVELEKDFKELPIGVYDGELIAEGEYKNSADQYKDTMKRSRIKGKKIGLKMMCYDFIANEKDFWNGRCNTKCIDRKNQVEKILNNANVEHVEYLYPLYIGKDVSAVEKYSAEAIANQEEGIMCNIADAPYEVKRTKNLLKVKIFKTADVLVEAIHEGDGKYANTLGRITVSFLYEGVKYSVDCGSGFSDSQRDYWYSHQNELIGKIVTLKIFEVSKNQQGGVGLRFPIWLNEIRQDKFGIEDTNVD